MSKNSTGTKEWAEANFNIINGCSHGCKYCYAHGIMARFGQRQANDWTNERLRSNYSSIVIRKSKGRIMYPSVHDITPKFIEEHVSCIRRLLEVGNTLLIVSKPHTNCIERLCQEFGNEKDRITFRFSIGSNDNEVLRFWEPGAPPYEERLESLRFAYEHGFQTSVSVEPMLEGNIDELIADLDPFVTDTIWLGKINRLKSNLTLNGFVDLESKRRAEALIDCQNDESIRAIYTRHKNNPKIRFKESIKRVIGIPLQTEAGLDI
jgi:DNA repair photolyase